MNEISVLDLKDLLESGQKNFIVIDVRTYEEREAGFIEGTVHIPLDELPLKLNEVLNKEGVEEIYFQCRSGKRSSNACTVFLQAGFEKSFNVKGGILAWEEAGFKISLK